MRARFGFLLCLGLSFAGGAAVLAGPLEKPSADQGALARANNQFALSLYERLAAEGQNLFLSPTSLSAALTMTYAGARGETADQMANVLHIGDLKPRIHTVFGAFLRVIDDQARQKGDRLEFASALWCQRGEKVLPEFASVLKRDYESDLNEVDFRDPVAASRAMNDWVARQTHGRVQEIASPERLESQARLILVNAIYFKGSWSKPFAKDHTWGEPFQTPNGSQEAVPFMHQSDMFPYWENGDLQLVELPCADGAIVVDLLLPRKSDGLKAIEAKFSVDSLNEWLAGLRKQNVDIALPKYQFTTSLELKGVLSKLGMPAAFGAKADFSGITPDGKGLSLAGLIHKAFIEVNEEGAEAAASSELQYSTTSVNSNSPCFRADHPFVFLVRDLRTGTILFIGRVVNPLGTVDAPPIRYNTTAQRTD